MILSFIFSCDLNKYGDSIITRIDVASENRTQQELNIKWSKQKVSHVNMNY